MKWEVLGIPGARGVRVHQVGPDKEKISITRSTE